MQNDAQIVKEITDEVSGIPMKEVLEDMNLMEPEELMPMLKLGRSTIYNLAHKGLLPSSKIGGAIRFRPRAVYAYILAKERMALGQAA